MSDTQSTWRLSELQREALQGFVRRQIQSQMALDRFYKAFPEPDRVPIPWYGQLRNKASNAFYWLRDLFEDWSDACAVWATDVRWYQRPVRPVNVGKTIQFRRWSPIERES